MDGDINDCSFGNSDSIDDCCLLAVAISPVVGMRFLTSVVLIMAWDCLGA